MAQNHHHFSSDNGSTHLPRRVLRKLKITAALSGVFAALAVSNPAYSSDKVAEADESVQNDKPVAKTDQIGQKDSSVAFNALANDADSDGDQLTLVDASARFGAVVFTKDGLLAYAQNPGPARADTITYIVSDGRGELDHGTVEILVP